MADTRVRIQRVTLDDIIDLRHRMLRQGLARDAAVFEGDRDSSSLHFGAFTNGTLIGCATLHASKWDDEPAWQLRGMAVDNSYQRTGIGADILQSIEAELQAANGRTLLWCNARVPAAPFYEKLGWRIVSEMFEIPTAGPHVRMFKRLASRE
jgi:GNAT superfamily N-acetyltransferase